MFIIFRGKCQGKDEPFRTDYGRLGELRSLIRKEVPFVTLTATATTIVKEQIIQNLCMQGCIQVLANPNRDNIRYAVVTVDIDNLYTSFSWLIDELLNKTVNTPKVIVFCRRKQHMKDLYELFSHHLGKKAYYMPNGNEPMDDRSHLFAMYHKKTHKIVKETVEKEFCKSNGTIRVLFCSIAFGMGVNIKDAFLDLHLGPAGDLDDFLQETGRIGRGSTQLSHTVLLKYKRCTSSKNITLAMRNYVNNDTNCRRDMLLNHFDVVVPKKSILHECCDICARSCKCLCKCPCDCSCSKKLCAQDGCLSSVEKHLAELECDQRKDKRPVHNLSQTSIFKMESDLLQYRLHLQNNLSGQHNLNMLTGFDAATGYSKSLIDAIIKNARYIKDKEYLNANFAFFCDEHMEKTWEIINSFLCDTDSNNVCTNVLVDKCIANSINDSGSSNSDNTTESSSSEDNWQNPKKMVWLHTGYSSSEDEISISSDCSS